MARTRLYLGIYVFVLAPVGAAVAIGAMLLFGVKPHTVFAPGFAIQALLHVPNRVAVVGTVATWWVAIVIVGLFWEGRRRRAAR
jgi:hypothetical protein